MTPFADNAWVVVALPFLLAAPVWLVGRSMRSAAPLIAAIGPLVVALTGFSAILADTEAVAVPSGTVTWLPGIERIAAGWMFDGLSAVMFAVVGTVALMVVVFSIGYMKNDAGWARYFMLLSLFTGSMSLLVVADSLLVLFVGWELVGACSYLLIGFWFEKPSASAAAVKAFLVTRVGDTGLLLGLALLWREVGSFEFATVFASLSEVSQPTVTTIALLLFLGAVGKSAQFPLHIWLPDAMEGPTPVSALIHAATMVAAGVFLIARMWPVFDASSVALQVILVIGAFTAVAAASIALVQRDIKKVLAYSTISQLGFMFAALGAGAWGIAMFHLVTHAAFKALLFLGSGSVIHGTGTQDMHEMGGLRSLMPVTAATWTVGALALAGVPPLAGFFSKDEVVHAVWANSKLAGVALLIASFMTAFYITRATVLTFGGTYRGHSHPHEAGLSMRAPLVVLAFAAAVLGTAGHRIAETLGVHAEALDPVTAIVSSVVAIVGIAASWFFYRGGAERDDSLAVALGPAWSAMGAGYGVDRAVEVLVIRPFAAMCAATYRVLEKSVIDRIAEGAAVSARRIGGALTALQNGDGQWYGALLGAGVVIMLAVVWSFETLESWGSAVSTWIGG